MGCANHVANENLFFSTSHFPFFLSVSLFLYSFILAFTESVRQNKQTITKNAVKQHKKDSPLMSFFKKFLSFSSKLFCFCFLRFFRKKTKKKITALEKKTEFFQ